MKPACIIDIACIEFSKVQTQVNHNILRMRIKSEKCFSTLSSYIFCCGNAQGKTASGTPCYLQPAAADCHYLKPGSDRCTSVSDQKRLLQGIVLVNRTLVSLEQQLVRLGVIPPDITCSRLPLVANGGVIYSALNLAPGITARYVCNAGYTLHGHQQHKFACTEDGVWSGDVIDVPVSCQLSPNLCNPPEDVPNGTIDYTNSDSSNVLIGDVVTYLCEEGYELLGDQERFCTRSGNWSGIQPQCIAVEVVEDPTSQSKLHRIKLIGISVGSAVASAVTLLVILVAIFGFYKCIGSRGYSKSNPSGISKVETREESGTPYTIYQDAPSSKTIESTSI